MMNESVALTSSPARSFLPTEPRAPSVVEPTATKRKEGVLVCLSGEIGEKGPISLAAVKRRLLLQPDTPTTIVINSRGGNTNEAFKIYDHLRALPTPMATVARQNCSSAALIIFMAADFRLAVPGTEFLLHESHMAADDLPRRLNARVLQQYADNMKSVDRQVLDLVEARTGFNRCKFEEEMNDESPMLESFAIESGLVHEWPGLNRCDPTWSNHVREIQSAKMILPRWLTTPNYLAACRASAHFPPVVD